MNSPGLCDERTAAVDGPANGRTRRQREKARNLRLESIGMLASGIVHDLNNVLSPIVLAAPLLREHATNPDDLKMITTLEQSAERGVELVRQILSFVHGAGSVQQIVQIHHIMQEAATAAVESFPKNIAVVDDIPGNLWPVTADPTQIHQVLLNLCVNARDAMPGGGVLKMSAENCLLDEASARRFEGARPGAWTVISVEDTGTGIPADVLPRIWEPFFSTKAPSKGTGLGLSTVKSIVENHHGFISLRTKEGAGTAFKIFLPAAEVPAVGRCGETPQSKPNGGNGELVLVADDEPHIREMTSVMLSRNGYRVVTAPDGVQAVAILATRGRDVRVLITDVMMPNLDGVALATIARHINPSIKVLGISGLSSAGRSNKIERFGGAFLFKPFKIHALLAAVANILHPQEIAEVA
ncbi:MAG TPA: ATP-binding protein [Opitutaceae bacterium]